MLCTRLTQNKVNVLNVYGFAYKEIIVFLSINIHNSMNDIHLELFMYSIMIFSTKSQYYVADVFYRKHLIR
jgi:hypothetical protein